MRVSLLPTDYNQILEQFQKARIRDRSKGRHLSSCIHYIVTKLEPGRFSGKLDPALAHQGFLWEDVWSWAIAKQFSSGKQIEIEEDGIFMTLDDFNVPDWRVVEFKATKMSARNPITSAKFWHWKVQICCYCRGMQTYQAELIPLWINGAYEMAGGRFGQTMIGKKGHPYLLEFTKQEQRETWDMVRRARDAMDREERAA